MQGDQKTKPAGSIDSSVASVKFAGQAHPNSPTEN
jgi:hypothetical protein